MQGFVVIKTCTNRIEAEVVKGVLSAYGIDAIITGDDEGGLYPYPLQPTTIGVQVYVKPQDFENAVKVLNTA